MYFLLRTVFTTRKTFSSLCLRCLHFDSTLIRATYASLPFSFYSTTLTLKSLDLIAFLEFPLFFPFPALHWPSSKNSFKKFVCVCVSLKSVLSRKCKPSVSKISTSLVTKTIKRSSFYISAVNKNLSLKYKEFRIELLLTTDVSSP